MSFFSVSQYIVNSTKRNAVSMSFITRTALDLLNLVSSFCVPQLCIKHRECEGLVYCAILSGLHIVAYIQQPINSPGSICFRSGDNELSTIPIS